MPMTLQRRPRAARRRHPVVLKEVAKAYNDTALQYIEWFISKISSWDDKPKFKYDVKVGRRVWRINVRVDMRYSGSKKFKWADEGTGERGGGEAYTITARNVSKLRYEVPSFPKTPPTGPINQAPEGVYFPKEVEHPGIWPRNWSEQFLELASSRTRSTRQTPPGFRAVTEAAVKRAFRKQGIY